MLTRSNVNDIWPLILNSKSISLIKLEMVAKDFRQNQLLKGRQLGIDIFISNNRTSVKQPMILICFVCLNFKFKLFILQLIKSDNQNWIILIIVAWLKQWRIKFELFCNLYWVRIVST